MMSLSLLTTALVLSSAFAQDRWLNITAKEAFNLYVDGEFVLAENSRNVSAVDSKQLTATSRLVAVQGINIAAGCPGIVASVSDDFLLTNASSWKCSAVSGGPDWAQLGFDDSLWPPAFEVKRNDPSDPSCSPELPYIAAISSSAWWIWIADTTMEVVYCRGYLAVCSSSPCVNGGTCNANSPALCTCPQGYTGIFCESEINACDSSPCQNGGQCQGSADAYQCFCRPGWTGTHCETEILECSSSPCQNGGTCWEFVNHYNCTCPVEYTGSRCETEIPPLTLLVTGDRGLLQLYVDGAEVDLDPETSMNWSIPLPVLVPGSARVLAVRCLNSFVDGCSGILASTDGGGGGGGGGGAVFVTDSVDWRCSHEDSSADWFQPDFDDSSWSKAIESDANGDSGPWTCGHRHQVPEISEAAFWIWSSNPTAPVNCRGYMMDPCANAPCLNGGVCSSAGEDYTCTCDDIYTGANCESDFSYDFVLTADRAVLALYVEGYFRPLTPAASANWTLTEHLPIARSTTVLGLRATGSVDASACSGIVASVASIAFATDSVRWKCSTDNAPGWYSPSYDDSHWANAVDYGANAGPFDACAHRHQLPDISDEARWIYTDDQTAPTVNCRGRLPPV